MSQGMRAARLHGGQDGNRLSIDDSVDVPTPNAGQVLVLVRACGVNQIDLLTRDGQTPQTPQFPHTSGTEVTGDLLVIGEGVEGWSVGDRVLVDPVIACGDCEFCKKESSNMCLKGRIFGVQTDGGYAEKVLVDSKQLLRLPNSLSYAQGAAIAVTGSTALHMLYRRAKVQAGEDVLIVAAGSGIGVIGVQLALLAGARVIVTAGSDERIRQALALGANFAVNHRDPDWAKQVREWTGGRGVDVVFEHVGEATWKGSLRALARGGRLVTCGGHSGFNVEIDLWNLFVKEQSIIGSFAGSRQDLEEVLSLAEGGKISPVIQDVIPLERMTWALSLMENRQVFGKIIIDPTLSYSEGGRE